ncbi:MAG: class I SAM-dependent methyltransferase [bacterium]
MTEEKIFEGYHCPACRAAIEKQENGLACPGCRSAFAARDGVPDFIGEDKKDGWRADEKETELVRIAREAGWREAVRRVFGGSRTEAWITDNSRGNGCLLTSINRDSVVLDAGCGCGVISFFLADYCKEVHCADSLFEYLEFIRLRAGQDGVGNVFPVRSGLMALPFGENSFDLIVLNGVLEHIPCFYKEDEPRAVQVRLLKKFAGLLRPGGEIYLGIENRFGLKYFMGAADEHTGMRFVTVLPRKLADFYSRIVRGRPFREYTHSYAGLRKMFAEAGFTIKKTCMPVKDYRDMKLLGDIDDPALFPFMLKLAEKRMGRSGRDLFFTKLGRLACLLGLHRIHLHRFFSHSFSIVAEKMR